MERSHFAWTRWFSGACSVDLEDQSSSWNVLLLPLDVQCPQILEDLHTHAHIAVSIIQLCWFDLFYLDHDTAFFKPSGGVGEVLSMMMSMI